MPKTYTVANDGTVAFVYDVMRRFHQQLADEKVTVSVLFVAGGLSLHGEPAHAIIKLNSLRDRVEGKEDVTLQLADHYPELKKEQQLALVDYELHHLTLVRHTRGKEAGKVKRDDAGRPKLRMRRHDLVVGGFKAIIERHGDAALEVGAIHHCGREAAEILGERDMRPAAPPAEIQSVTFEMPSQGRSVTLTGEQFATIGDLAEALTAAAIEEPRP